MDRELSASSRWRHGVKRWLPLLLGVAVVFFLLRGVGGFLKPSVKRSAVRIGTVESGSLTAVLTGAGTVQPASDQVISSPVEGRVLRVLRQPGAVVEEGEALLELDVGQAALALSRLEGEREQRLSERHELELSLEERLIDLRSQMEVRALDVEELSYRVEQDQRLHDRGLISEVQLRESLTRQRKAKIQLASVEKAMVNRRQSVDAQLASLDAQLRTVGRELTEARQKAAMAITRADRPGLVTYVLDEVGTAVRPGDVLARIADPDRYRVEATIADLHASRMGEGQAVEVPIGEATLTGRVERILPAVTDGALRFLVALDEPSNPALRTNLRTDVLVVVDRRENALRVPKGPSVSSTGTQTLFVVEGAVARPREVRLGLSGHRHYEVLDGLVEGEQVVLSDMNRFLDAEEVKLR